ncbi:hypothetical protein BRC67_04600 [Halobacteriales archaeon QH_3_68_24]|nr:MAG: hypothetical protein BRC67_04600 [Halobacteriales archaeon QH_3_68_24]
MRAFLRTGLAGYRRISREKQYEWALENIGRRERTYHPRVAAADEGRGSRQSPRMTGNEHWG